MPAATTYRLGATLLGYVVSFALLVISASHRIGLVVVVWALCLLVTSIALSLQLRWLGPSRLATALRTVIPVTMLVIGLAMVWIWYGGHRPGWGFFGGCLAVMGAGHLLAVARRASFLVIARGALLIVAGGAAFAFGLRAYSGGGGPGWMPWLMVAGLLLVPVGMGLLTEDVVDRLATLPRRSLRRWGPVLLGAGVAAVATGVWLLVAVGRVEFVLVAAATVVLAVVVGSIAANTPADVVLVAAILALVWANVPRGVDRDPLVVPVPGQDVIVALGDSFMSGEGAKHFYAGTNEKDRNECRRAPTAYAPVMVARDSPAIPDHLAFVACSGARALDIYQRAQQPGDPLDRPEGGLNQLAHVDWLQTSERLDVKLVIVSIGGNDALFGDIAQACVAPGDCTELGARFLARLAVVAPRVHATYQRIRNFFGPDVPVLVVPYPVPLSEHKCPSSLLTEREHVFLHAFTVELNRVLERAASDAGLHYLREMTTAFEDRRLRICDDSSGRVGVNFLAMHAMGGLVEQSLNPQNWLHNSLHPNERGHQAMADVLQDWLERQPYQQVPPDPPPAQEQNAEPIGSVESLMGDADFRHCGNDPSIPHCDLETLAWARAQIITLVLRSIGPLLLTIAGLWAIWIWLIWFWRSMRYRSRPPALLLPANEEERTRDQPEVGAAR